MYVAVVWRKAVGDSKIVVNRSTTSGASWNNICPTCQLGSTGILGSAPALGVAPNHNVYLVWREDSPSVRFFFSKSTDKGVTWTNPGIPLTDITLRSFDLGLKRSNSALASDVFRAPVFPNLAVNQSK